MTKEEREKLKNLLLKEQAEIEQELNLIADKSELVKGDYRARFPGASDPSDPPDVRAQDISEFERQKAAEQTLELRLREINETLKRLDADDYGTCTNCKSPIQPARLRVMPMASLCMNCAKISR